ncbi:aminoacyl-tRNA hydrolase [Candidatus Saccharibacteria bacterium]|nr:aminoacyl-tRNA hydrolase [Candidatus Saccharibacteria bacterium]
MKVIVGLGNPEPRYTGTRHNIGYEVVLQFATSLGGTFTQQNRFHAYTAQLTIGTEKVIVVMPTTYYNLSGESVRAVIDFYKLTAQDVLVVHDELMLPVGTLRTRQGGGDAGNNGMKSITQHLGEHTARVRIGIANEQREQIDDADFVLSKFNAQERQLLAQLQHTVEGCIEDFIFGQFTATTHVSAVN